jgi:hypothetical protein
MAMKAPTFKTCDSRDVEDEFMTCNRRFNRAVVCRLACAIGVLVACVPAARAALVNKYTFNDNTANDSVGGQNGVVVDNTGIARYTGGAIDLSGNNGAGSNQDFSLPTTVGAFVDLPNGIFTGAVNGGTAGTVSLEMWLTVQQHRDWAEAFVFGTSNGGEGISDSGSATAYVALIPQSGPDDFRATTKAATGNPAEIPLIATPTPLPPSQRQHVVLVLDQNNIAAGPNGTASLYLNNGAPATAQISGFLDLVVDNNNWLGRSQWPDPLFDGTIDEFRIYDHALTATEVAQSFNTGPEPAPLPVLVVNRDTGAISLANQSTGNIQIKGYSITSAAGALDPATWTSIDATNAFDPNGTWTAQSSTSTNLSESVTGGTLDGGTLAPSATRGIGTPWIKTPFEDLLFSFTLGDNSMNNGVVLYTGNSGAPIGRSDLNGDGAVNVADWSLFLPNAFTAFASDTAVAAYRKGDLDGDKDNDYADFLLFKADFVAANGAAAFIQLGGAVPEPTTLALAVAALSLLGFGFRRTR